MDTMDSWTTPDLTTLGGRLYSKDQKPQPGNRIQQFRQGSKNPNYSRRSNFNQSLSSVIREAESLNHLNDSQGAIAIHGIWQRGWRDAA